LADGRLTCVVTGATAGIGLETARRLAAGGARLALVGRNADKLRAAAAQVGGDALTFVADLSRQSEVRAVAHGIAAKLPRIDVLVNNAGGLFVRRDETADGIERTFALNHLGYFLLTHLLLGPLRAAPAGRIVNVASMAHRKATIDFDDLEGRRGYNAWKAYGQSKLANVMFTYELARRLRGSSITVNALHPGFVNSDFGENNGLIARQVIRLAKTFGGIPVAKGAETPVYLATSREVAGRTSEYYDRCRAVRSNAASYDEAAQRRLWEVSARMVKL
jgi:NAD(P)-dependent dehydrogenase (short-subunit alcohol dehydrogenase family)